MSRFLHYLPRNHYRANKLVTGVVVLTFLRVASFYAASPALPQREQVERNQTSGLSRDIGSQRRPTESGVFTQDNAFGKQVILQEKPKQSAFQVFGEVAAFYTSNALLSRDGAEGDSFVNATAGLGWRHNFNDRLTLAISGRYSIYRYNQFSALDFQSVDADVRLGYTLFKHWELAVGYGFTRLTSRGESEAFYTGHSVDVGLQRVFEVSSAHHIVVGLSPSWSVADPSAAQRDKYTAYAAWYWRLSDRFATNLAYRYGYYVYRGGDAGRRDHNHTVSLSAQYDLTDWLALTASGYATWNRSNLPDFNYAAWNLGGSVGLNARF